MPLSATANKELMAQARASLKGQWGIAIGAFFIYAVISFAVGYLPCAGSIISILITGPMTLGLCIFVLCLTRKQQPQLSYLFAGFSKFGTALGAYILQIIFILLWSLLFLIPGIIASLSYAMTFYILADPNNMGPLEAIRKSKEIMYGNRWKFFCLGLRFLGWFILCIPTLGIGFLWLGPYIWVSQAKFYDDIAPPIPSESDATI